MRCLYKEDVGSLLSVSAVPPIQDCCDFLSAHQAQCNGLMFHNRRVCVCVFLCFLFLASWLIALSPLGLFAAGSERSAFNNKSSIMTPYWVEVALFAAVLVLRQCFYGMTFSGNYVLCACVCVWVWACLCDIIFAPMFAFILTSFTASNNHLSSRKCLHATKGYLMPFFLSFLLLFFLILRLLSGLTIVHCWTRGGNSGRVKSASALEHAQRETPVVSAQRMAIW